MKRTFRVPRRARAAGIAACLLLLLILGLYDNDANPEVTYSLTRFVSGVRPPPDGTNFTFDLILVSVTANGSGRSDLWVRGSGATFKIVANDSTLPKNMHPGDLIRVSGNLYPSSWLIQARSVIVVRSLGARTLVDLKSALAIPIVALVLLCDWRRLLRWRLRGRSRSV